MNTGTAQGHRGVWGKTVTIRNSWAAECLRRAEDLHPLVTTEACARLHSELPGRLCGEHLPKSALDALARDLIAAMDDSPKADTPCA